MAIIREEETVHLIFSRYGCTIEVKFNTDWQMGISLKSADVVDEIASIAAIHWVDNFRPCKKHLRFLAKRVSPLIKNVSLGDLDLQLEESWRNREVFKLA